MESRFYDAGRRNQGDGAVTNENRTNDELTSQDDVESNEVADRRVDTWLNSRVPEEVPSEVTVEVCSTIAAELKGIKSSATEESHAVEAASRVARRRRPSLGVVTTALIVLTIGLNVLVAWRSDRQIAAVVGDEGERASVPTNETDEPATRRISVAALFEFNASLIQRELNYERVESTRIGFHERRQSTSPTEEGHPKEVPDRSGAAVGPGSGIQRRPKLAIFVTA